MKNIAAQRLTLTVSRCAGSPTTCRNSTRKATGTAGSADHQRCVQPVTATFPASLANRDQNELNEIRPSGFWLSGKTGSPQWNRLTLNARSPSAESTIPAITRAVCRWCREEASVNAGLPNVSELVVWFTSIAGSVACIRMQSLIREIERALLVGYQLVPKHAGQWLTDAELRRKAADELTCMTAQLTVVRRYLNQ